MITIHCCTAESIKSEEKFPHYVRYTRQKALIIEADREDGHIYTVPHNDSFLRRKFIEPHLTDEGYPIFGRYKTEMCGKKIKYELVDNIYN